MKVTDTYCIVGCDVTSGTVRIGAGFPGGISTHGVSSHEILTHEKTYYHVSPLLWDESVAPNQLSAARPGLTSIILATQIESDKSIVLSVNGQQPD